MLDEAREPNDLLMACHDRIRHFGTLALRLARATHAAEDQLAEAAARLQRYFRIALPLHERDEEDSLAPRLLESTARGEVKEALDRMAREHRSIDAMVAALDLLWGRIASDPRVLASIADELQGDTNALVELFGNHLGLEEAVLFPPVTRVLSRAARDIILQEIKDRRSAEIRASMSALMTR